jgi:hypothetical protein
MDNYNDHGEADAQLRAEAAALRELLREAVGALRLADAPCVWTKHPFASKAGKTSPCGECEFLLAVSEKCE